LREQSKPFFGLDLRHFGLECNPGLVIPAQSQGGNGLPVLLDAALALLVALVGEVRYQVADAVADGGVLAGGLHHVEITHGDVDVFGINDDVVPVRLDAEL